MRDVPRHSLHKASGRGRVRINGRDFYTGIWGTSEAQKNYDRLIAEWLANGRRLPDALEIITTNKLWAAFEAHAKVYYKRMIGRMSEADNFRYAFAPVLNLYSGLPVDAFQPAQLKTVREEMVKADLCRNSVNARLKRVRHIFKWGVSELLVQPNTLAALQAVPSLARGRSPVRESEAVKPVPELHISITSQHVSEVIQDIISMLLLTGARPGEIVSMTAQPLDTSEETWVYRPSSHKTDYRGKHREIYLNAAARKIISKYLTTDPSAPLFRNRNGRAYTVDSLRTAIVRGCERANVPEWSPGQLRHNVGTFLRKHFGLDVASFILGHSKPDTTLIYAEPHREAAIQAIASLTG